MEKQIMKIISLQWDVNELTTTTALPSSSSEFFSIERVISTLCEEKNSSTVISSMIDYIIMVEEKW